MQFIDRPTIKIIKYLKVLQHVSDHRVSIIKAVLLIFSQALYKAH